MFVRVSSQKAALEDGLSVDHVHSLSRIDRWFLCKLRNIALMRKVSLDLSRSTVGFRAFPSVVGWIHEIYSVATACVGEINVTKNIKMA